MKTIYISYSDYEDTHLQTTECCGIEELYNLTKQTDAVIAKVADVSWRRAMIIFHDVVGRNGDRLARKIRRLKLGKLLQSPECNNPNTGNTIRLWTWIPDWVAIDNYRERFETHDDYWD